MGSSLFLNRLLLKTVLENLWENLIIVRFKFLGNLILILRIWPPDSFFRTMYRVRTWSCHPLSKAIFKYQNMCCTKIPLKILPGIQKSILKNSWTKIGKNFSVFSVKMKFWKMFEFVLWKYIKSLIFSTQYGCIAVSQIKPNFTIFCAYGPSWRGPNGVNYILNYFCTQCLDI